MSALGDAARSYGGAAITTATAIDLCVLLAERALRDLDGATAAMRDGRRADALSARTHARAVVLELMAGLDRDRGGPLAERLAALYLFAAGRLVGPLDADSLRDVREVVASLLDGFRTIRRGSREVA